MARVLAVGSDLMLASRVQGILSAAGHEVRTAPAISGADLEGIELIVADLAECDPAELAAAGPPVLGFHQHTDPGTRERALAAGVELAVPRSRLVREMPELAAELLA